MGHVAYDSALAVRVSEVKTKRRDLKRLFDVTIMFITKEYMEAAGMDLNSIANDLYNLSGHKLDVIRKTPSFSKEKSELSFLIYTGKKEKPEDVESWVRQYLREERDKGTDKETNKGTNKSQ